MNLTAKAIFVVLMSCSASLCAQLELGINAGLSTYQGDLAPSSRLEMITQGQRSIGVYGRFQAGYRLSFRAFVQSSKVRGTDQLRESTQFRNLSFRTHIFELGALAEFFPLGMNVPFAPYISAGASVYNFNPETLYNGRYVELQPLGTEGQGLPGFAPRYELTRMAVPLGVGVRHQLGSAFTIGLDLSTRMLFFDHLDDVSGNYVNYYTLLDGRGIQGSNGNGSLAAALGDRQGEFFGTEPRDVPSGSRRGDPTNNDWFYTATVTIGYNLGAGLFGGGTSSKTGSRYNKCYQF